LDLQVNIKTDESFHDLENRTRKKKIYAGFAGGIGKFGSNFSFLRYKNFTLWVDFGGGFPDIQFPGMSRMLPNFIPAMNLPPATIVLTHAHEDHIGGIPYFYDAIPENTPIYGSRFTLELLKTKLRDFRFPLERFVYHEIKENSEAEAGPFILHFFFMNHSVPAALSIGVSIPEENKKIFYSGDFKMRGDDHRVNHEDIRKFGPVDYLALDSTGSLSDGTARAENEVLSELEQIIHSWNGRIFISTFSSHIERIRNIYRITKKEGIPLGIQGYSIKAHLTAALEAGEIDFPVTSLRDPSPNAKKSVWLVAGCQSEPGSSMYKVAREEIEKFRLGEKDLFVYSASMIPGNEGMIYESFNHLAARGVKVVGIHSHEFHSSGHGKKEDILMLIRLLSPTVVFPIHGDNLHFSAMKQLLGKEIRVEIPDPSVIYSLEKEIKKETSMGNEVTLVEEKELHNDRSLYKKRAEMGENGMMIIIIRETERDLFISIRYVGVTSQIFQQKSIDHIEETSSDIISEIINSASVKKDKKIRDKITRLNKSVLGKTPLIEIFWL